MGYIVSYLKNQNQTNTKQNKTKQNIHKSLLPSMPRTG
jgi:hypothetical protein